jgi:hypothetical protein
MQWSLRAMLLLVAIIAISLGIVRAYWQTTWPNSQLALAFYLLLTSVAIVAAARSAVRYRAGFLGASIFSLLYLVCGINAGFGFESYSEGQLLMRRTLLGFPFVALSFLTTQFCVIVLSPQNE